MKPTRRAVIDVGTNSIKLLVGDVSNGLVTPVDERSEQTRLGAGFYEQQLLQPVPIARTASAVAKFVALARESDAESVRLIATSAARTPGIAGPARGRAAGGGFAHGNYFRRPGGRMGFPRRHF
jgi:exopolyphosphatase/pppGpp-phosphohydrolase